MSKQTSVWLNTMTLIGQTDKRGNAWHYRAADQGDESNHYPGFIPVEDVRRRLLNWEVRTAPVMVNVPASGFEDATGMDADGNPVRTLTIPNKQALIASDTGHVFSIFSGGYEVHQYDEWLINNVQSILGTDLGISSAGLLADRGICWVEVSTPETLTAEGFTYRPNLVACTSHTGKLATTYQRTITATVCDNTLSAALSEGGERVKIKHTRGSALATADKVKRAREALGIVHEMAAETGAAIREMVNTPVSALKLKTVIGAMVPVTDDMTPGARTRANNKIAELRNLWMDDKRVTPWKGTAFGVVQMFNTWDHHFARVNSGTDRGQRNTLDALTGETAKRDAEIMRVLAGV